MTNERAIYLLKSILPKKVSFAQTICASNCYGDEMVYESPEPYAIEYAINSIQENAKLKAEIERIKNESHRRSDMFLQEIERLKEELEQSVRLPCKIGDDIYFRVKGRNQFAEYVDFIQTQKITRIDINVDGILYCSATEKFIECDINKTIFLTREEAEQSLKGKVEE